MTLYKYHSNGESKIAIIKPKREKPDQKGWRENSLILSKNYAYLLKLF